MRQNKTHLGVLAAGMVISSLILPSNLEAGMDKLWPFASKKHIKQQIDPVSGRVSELEEIGRKHDAQIKEIDERTQSALRATMSQVEAADAKAVAAGQKANEAGVAADKAFASAGDAERRLSSRLENVENYRLVRTVQVGFNPARLEWTLPRGSNWILWPLRFMAQKDTCSKCRASPTPEAHSRRIWN